MSEHRSPGISLTAGSAPGSLNMQWTRNGELQETHFDADGNVLDCSSGLAEGVRLALVARADEQDSLTEEELEMFDLVTAMRAE